MTFKRFLRICLFRYQVCSTKILLFALKPFSHYFLAIFADKTVIGFYEHCSNILSISSSVQNSIPIAFNKESADLKAHPQKYIFGNAILRFGYSLHLLRPLWLACILIGRPKCILYFSRSSILLDSVDFRSWEFKIVSRFRIPIICQFTGNDIRSIEMQKNKFPDLRLINSYMGWTVKIARQENYEQIIKQYAKISEKYASLIINDDFCQISYFSKPSLPVRFFLEDYVYIPIEKSMSHFYSKELILLHCPRDPISKGTQVIHSVIDRLRIEGFLFEYIELVDLSREEVLRALRSSHIVINELYSMAPGLFAYEALANHNALITSADPERNTSISCEKGLWVTAYNHNLYCKLRDLLCDRSLIYKYADLGLQYTKKYMNSRKAEQYYNNLFSSISNKKDILG